MNMIKSLLCEANAVMIVCYVLDVILILGAIGLFVWYSVKSSKKQKAQNIKNEEKATNDVEKINDDTYVLQNDLEVPEEEPEFVQQDNAIEHFANQITGINEPTSTELKSTAVIVSHEVEQPVKKIVKKEEIQNYVMLDGVKKEKTEHERVKSLNRGTDAFKNSTNFLNSIKEESAEVASSSPASITSAEKKTTARKTIKK